MTDWPPEVPPIALGAEYYDDTNDRVYDSGLFRWRTNRETGELKAFYEYRQINPTLASGPFIRTWVRQ